MQTILRTVEGSIVLTENTEILGVVTGNVTVSGGARVIMDGMVMGDFVVLEGSSAEVTGTVAGYIINDGGSLKVRGLDEDLGKAGVLPPRAQRNLRQKSFWGFAR